MSYNRKSYGLVKIKNIYYAILGLNDKGFSSSIDIFNHQSGKWELKSGLNYELGETTAVEFQNKIYATGSGGKILLYDPSSNRH